MTQISAGSGAQTDGDGARGETQVPVGGGRSIGTSTTATLAERLGIGVYDLEVVEVVKLAPSIRRLRVGAVTEGALAAFSFEAGQDLMLDVQQVGDRIIRRRYTVRRFDHAQQLIDIDLVLHGEGPAARWAASATPGTPLVAIGPRGKVILDADSTFHLFVGDESFVPAASAMLEALSPAQRAVGIFEVDAEADAQAIRGDLSANDTVAVHFIERGGKPVGEAGALLEALERIEIPAEKRHVYVAGEHQVVAAIRKSLAARGLSADEVSPKSYWRRGQANGEHGEPNRDSETS